MNEEIPIVKLQNLLEQFTIKPQWVDKIICSWTFSAGHSFTENELNSLVESLSDRLSAELRSNFMEKHFGPPKIIGEAKFKDGQAIGTGVLSDMRIEDEDDI